MSKISRSEYQKVCEENKRLIDDLRIICCGEPEDSIIVEMKWHDHFIKENEFQSLMKDTAKRYLDEHPELRRTV